MPKAARNRLSRPRETEPSGPIIPQATHSLPSDGQVTHDQSGQPESASSILQTLTGSQNNVNNNNKRKILGNQRTRDSIQPYSKSHAKRMKKKEKEQAVVGDLNPVKQALDEVLLQHEPQHNESELAKHHQQVVANNKSKKQNIHHENSTSIQKNQTKKSISQKQKAKVLQEESIRLPNILKHSQFRKNPFAAIRTHIKNTQTTTMG